VVSTLGRMPGTWALSAQGAKAAAGGQTPAAARALVRRELKEFKKGH